jgi:hypothetical protein
MVGHDPVYGSATAAEKPETFHGTLQVTAMYRWKASSVGFGTSKRL